MKWNNEKVTMLHGAGGTVMHDLVKNYIVKHFKNIDNVDKAEVPLQAMDDAAAIGDIVLKRNFCFIYVVNVLEVLYNIVFN